MAVETCTWTFNWRKLLLWLTDGSGFPEYYSNRTNHHANKITREIIYEVQWSYVWRSGRTFRARDYWASLIDLVQFISITFPPTKKQVLPTSLSTQGLNWTCIRLSEYILEFAPWIYQRVKWNNINGAKKN